MRLPSERNPSHDSVPRLSALGGDFKQHTEANQSCVPAKGKPVASRPARKQDQRSALACHRTDGCDQRSLPPAARWSDLEIRLVQLVQKVFRYALILQPSALPGDPVPSKEPWKQSAGLLLAGCVSHFDTPAKRVLPSFSPKRGLRLFPSAPMCGLSLAAY